MQKQYILFAHAQGLGLFKQINPQKQQLSHKQFKLKDCLHLNFDVFLTDFQHQILPYNIVDFLARNLPTQDIQLLINELELLQLIKHYLPLQSVYNECQYSKFDLLEQIQQFTKSQKERILISKVHDHPEQPCRQQLIELIDVEIIKEIDQLQQVTKSQTHLLLDDINLLKQILQNTKLGEQNEGTKKIKLLCQKSINLVQYFNYIICSEDQYVHNKKPIIMQPALLQLIGAEKALFRALKKKYPEKYENAQKKGKISRILANQFGNQNK